jgi:uncharacterized protein (TIGR02646 family)
MRRRPVPKRPPELDPGDKERDAAIAHYGDPSWRTKKSFEFKAYKRVRDVLTSAFDDKCAYCETCIVAGQPTAVEHYRPKGAIDTETERRRPPGYYWLACEWENLLPSCTRCNSAEEQDHADGTRRVSGKGMWFPLADESKRATAPDGEAGERPLLLHPYFDDPDSHLRFGEGGIVSGLTREGRKTIEILGLNRDGLVKARRTRLVSVRVQLTRIARIEQALERNPDDVARQEELEAEMHELMKLAAINEPYSAVAKHATREPDEGVARPTG